MSFRRTPLTVGALVLVGLGLSAPARAADNPTATIAPRDTDAAILDTTPTRGNHLVWLPPTSRRVGKLLVFLPSGGATNLPNRVQVMWSSHNLRIPSWSAAGFAGP